MAVLAVSYANTMTADAEHQERRYFTVREAAQVCGLSMKTLRRWAENGWLPCVLVDGERRFAREHLEAVVMSLDVEE